MRTDWRQKLTGGQWARAEVASMMDSDDGAVGALLRDYEQARDDERHFQALQGSAIAVALTAVSLLGAVAFVIGGDDDVPDVISAGAPLIVLSVLAFIQSAGAVAVLRSYYMRALERELRTLTGLNAPLNSYPGLRPLSLIELQISVTSLNPTASHGKYSFQCFMTGSYSRRSRIVFVALWILLRFERQFVLAADDAPSFTTVPQPRYSVTYAGE